MTTKSSAEWAEQLNGYGMANFGSAAELFDWALGYGSSVNVPLDAGACDRTRLRMVSTAGLTVEWDGVQWKAAA